MKDLKDFMSENQEESKKVTVEEVIGTKPPEDSSSSYVTHMVGRGPIDSGITENSLLEAQVRLEKKRQERLENTDVRKIVITLEGALRETVGRVSTMERYLIDSKHENYEIMQKMRRIEQENSDLREEIEEMKTKCQSLKERFLGFFK